MPFNRFLLAVPPILYGTLSAQSPTPPSSEGNRTNAERAADIGDGKLDPGSRREPREQKDPPRPEPKSPK